MLLSGDIGPSKLRLVLNGLSPKRDDDTSFPLFIVFIMDSDSANLVLEKTRCVCETPMPPKHPSFEKHDTDI